jgi:hypothetical protein
MGPAKAAGHLRPDQTKRLRMKKASDDSCNCYSVAGVGVVRYCDKHRPTRSGTKGRG